MKRLTIILLALTFISCSPFISKDLRRKNKCNRKYKRAVKKCPELLSKDTAVVIYDTIIVTPPSKMDTAISFNFDTVTLFKDKLRLKLIKTTDTLLIDAECLPDTIRIETQIRVPYETFKEVELTITDKILNFLNKWFWYIIVVSFIVIVLRLVYKFFFK